MPTAHLKRHLLFRISWLLALLGLGGWFTVALAQAAPLPKVAPLVAVEPGTVHGRGACDYQILVQPGAGGVITPGTGPYACGSTVVFTITPDVGYTTADVRVNGISVGAVSQYTFTNLSAPHFITAAFAVRTFTLFPVAGSGGSIVPGTAQVVNYGTAFTFSIVPNTGYHIADVGVDGIAQGVVSTYTFTNITASHIISAIFALNTYAISSTVVGAGGSITPAGVQTYTHGASQAYQVAANSYYYVGGVWVDEVAQSVPGFSTVFTYPFSNITANHTLTATFAPMTYSIFSAASPVGWGTITPNGTQFVPRGDSLAFTIVPNACSTIASLYVDGFAIAPTTAYTFSNVTDHHIITATFAPLGFHIVPVVTGNGMVTPSAAITAYYGTSYPFTMTPNAGNYLAQLRINGQLTTPVPIYTFSNVCSNQILAADFVTRTYNITATTGPSGTISPAGVSTVIYGSDKAFTITPNLYHHIENMWIDGVLQPFNQVSTLYTFTNVSAHHTISVTFAPDYAPLYVRVVNSYTVVHGAVILPGGSTCTTSCSSVYYGSPWVTMTAAINDGKFLHWGGAYTGTQNPYTLQMVTTRTITAYFSLHQVYLPFIRKNPPCSYDTSETEPNNFITETISYGTLCSGLTYRPLPNDYQDWFYFDIPTASTGPVFITMTNNTAYGVQLQLRDSLNNLLAYTYTGPVFQINCPIYVTPNCTPGTAFPPGRYYIVVYATNNYNNTPYNLTVTYPGPTPP